MVQRVGAGKAGLLVAETLAEVLQHIVGTAAKRHQFVRGHCVRVDADVAVCAVWADDVVVEVAHLVLVTQLVADVVNTAVLVDGRALCDGAHATPGHAADLLVALVVTLDFTILVGLRGPSEPATFGGEFHVSLVVVGLVEGADEHGALRAGAFTQGLRPAILAPMLEVVQDLFGVRVALRVVVATHSVTGLDVVASLRPLVHLFGPRVVLLVVHDVDRALSQGYVLEPVLLRRHDSDAPSHLLGCLAVAISPCLGDGMRSVIPELRAIAILLAHAVMQVEQIARSVVNVFLADLLCVVVRVELQPRRVAHEIGFLLDRRENTATLHLVLLDDSRVELSEHLLGVASSIELRVAQDLRQLHLRRDDDRLAVRTLEHLAILTRGLLGTSVDCLGEGLHQVGLRGRIRHLELRHTRKQPTQFLLWGDDSLLDLGVALVGDCELQSRVVGQVRVSGWVAGSVLAANDPGWQFLVAQAGHELPVLVARVKLFREIVHSQGIVGERAARGHLEASLAQACPEGEIDVVQAAVQEAVDDFAGAQVELLDVMGLQPVQQPAQDVSRERSDMDRLVHLPEALDGSLDVLVHAGDLRVKPAGIPSPDSRTGLHGREQDRVRTRCAQGHSTDRRRSRRSHHRCRSRCWCWDRRPRSRGPQPD